MLTCSSTETWCTNQLASCPLLCTQISSSSATAANTCDAKSLAYTCVCSNGQAPNASDFSQTIPYYQCQTANVQCANNCGGNSGCVAGCNSRPCGAQNPTRVNVTSTSSVASATGSAATASGSGDVTGTAGADATQTGGSTGFFGAPAQTSSSAASSHFQPGTFTFHTAERYGLAVVFASLFAGFALFL